jgi:predicted DNA-binding transcriptional regulator AlpA
MARDGKNGNGAARADTGAASLLLSERQVAERLNVSEVTLQEWRCQHKGPPFLRLSGRMIRYRESDIEAWLVEQEVRPSRLVGPSPNGGLGQYFERVERRTPVEGARSESRVASAAEPALVSPSYESGDRRGQS